MADLSYKPYPCCRFNHTAIDAALAIAKEPGFDAGAVRRITVGINRQAWEAVAWPLEIRQAPATVVQAPFSICYRSEEPTSELQSLMRISYAVFCLKKKTIPK